MVDTWPSAKIGRHLQKTETRDPRKKPHDEFIYVDVSSVDNRLFRITNASTMKGADAPSRARKVIRKGDVIYATVRPTLKRVAHVPQEYDEQICSTGYCILRTNEALYSKFLYFWLLTDEITKQVEGIQRGASYPAIRDSDVKKIAIPLPPLTEQRRIAAVLSLLQRAIEQQERLIGLTTELKKALMHKLFAEGTRGEPQKQTEIGPIPKSWGTKKIKEVSKLIVDCPHSTPKFLSQGISVIKNLNIREGLLLLTPEFFVSEEEYESRIKRAKLKERDVIFSREAPIGEACTVPKGLKACLGQRLMQIRVDEKAYNPRFLVYTFYSDETKKRLLLSAKGVTAKHINVADVKNFAIPMPTLEEQNEVVKTLSVLDRKNIGHQAQLKRFRELFRTFLHQLMTAEIRVNDLDLEELGLDSEK